MYRRDCVTQIIVLVKCCIRIVYSTYCSYIFLPLKLYKYGPLMAMGVSGVASFITINKQLQ